MKKTVSQALVSLNQAVRKIPPQSKTALDKLASFNTAQAQRVLQEVADGLTPVCRQIMGQTFSQSGIDSKSGDLKKASVDGLKVLVGKKGFRIVFASGFDQKVYIRGAVFRYGAVKGSGTEGFTKRGKRGLKAFAKKADKTGGSVEGVTLLKAKPPFYRINKSDPRLMREQEKLFRQAFARRGIR